jgi:uncharacterized protein (UPF0332 family)
MKEKNFFDCIFQGSTRKQTPDRARANSLVETANERMSLIREVNEKNANFVFEDHYTSMMEILQALCFSKGLNVLNHVCLGYYLRDELKRDDLYKLFEDLRYKRNSLTYYGNKMDFETAKDAIEKAKKMIRALEVYHKAMLE